MLIQERLLQETLLVSNSSLNARYLLNINQYHQMIEHGILTENDKIELIKGELITMSPVGIKHVAFVNRLNRIFHKKLADQVLVSVQNPVTLDEQSEPEPDLVLLRPSVDDYESQKPQIEDILLIIEVSDRTLKYDRTVKIPLYSEAKIREIWIIDINSECVEIYRYANTEGYDQMQRYRLGETLSILAFPDIYLTVNEIFGK
jgi:Uma2 family endonuclease